MMTDARSMSEKLVTGTYSKELAKYFGRQCDLDELHWLHQLHRTIPEESRVPWGALIKDILTGALKFNTGDVVKGVFDLGAPLDEQAF